MEMAQIRYALAAARTLNFTKAARECHVSQPALTKAIKALEDELGAPLFRREAKQIQLSELGRSMLAQFQQIVDGAEAAQALAQNHRLLNRVPIRLGVMTTVGHLRMSRFIAQFERKHPGVELAFRSILFMGSPAAWKLRTSTWLFSIRRDQSPNGSTLIIFSLSATS